MSRPLRIEYPYAWYHVMNRGLGRRHIFDNDAHYRIFIDLLSDLHQQFKVEIHAYCLMNNHYHLILHTPEGNLSRAMRHLNGLYTQKYNRSVSRDGPLFRGRYKSILIEADHYLLQLNRYIHLNPLAAKLVEKPEQFQWSSYKAYVKAVQKPVWLFCDEVLSQFRSMKDYKNYIKEGMNSEIANLFDQPQLPSVLGSKEFIANIRSQIKQTHLIDPEITGTKNITKKYANIDALIADIAKHYQVKVHQIKCRGHRYQENRLKKIAIYLAGRHLGYTNKEIAKTFGNISDSAVSRFKTMIDVLKKKDQILRTEIEKLLLKLQPISNIKD